VDASYQRREVPRARQIGTQEAQESRVGGPDNQRSLIVPTDQPPHALSSRPHPDVGVGNDRCEHHGCREEDGDSQQDHIYHPLQVA